MNTEEKIIDLIRRTGLGQIACGISLTLAGGDIEATIKRMKIAYPGLEVKE